MPDLETTASVAVEEPVASPTTTDTTVPPVEDADNTAPPAEQEPELASSEGEQSDQSEPDLEEAPEDSGKFAKFKDTYKTHPELRGIVGREAAFTELFPKLSEARQIREWFPTFEDAESVVTQAETLRKRDETFRSDPEAYAESLRETDRNAFDSFVAKLPDLLARTDNRLYTDQARSYVTSVFENLQEMAQQSGNEDFLTALRMVASQGLGINLGMNGYKANRPDPRAAEVERLSKQLKEREEADRASAYTSFVQGVEADFSEACLAEIEKGVKAALPNAKEKQVKRIVSETWETVNEKLKAQPQTTSHVKTVYDAARKGKTSLSDGRGLTEFLVRRAKAVIPNISKEVISEWTKEVIGTSNANLTKQKGIADKSKDVGTGVNGGGSAAATPAKQTGPRTASSIMQQLANGTYQPRA